MKQNIDIVRQLQFIHSCNFLFRKLFNASLPIVLSVLYEPRTRNWKLKKI